MGTNSIRFDAGRVHGFPPIEGRDTRVLILGTIPTPASVQARQYYAQASDAFWPIMARALGFDAEASYAERIAALVQARIGLWDVLKSCVRKSERDSDLEPASMIVNDIGSFLTRHRTVGRICFNGAQAEVLFRQLVLPDLSRHLASVGLLYRPSTSANCSAIPPEAKHQSWAAALL